MRIMPFILALLLTAGLGGCSPDTEMPTPRPPAETPGGNPGQNPEGGDPEQPPQTPIAVQITIGSATFTATLGDNPAARAFQTQLPMSVTMDELNGNEKYHYLPNPLPTSATNPGTIHSGEIMLFGSSTLVLFYTTFPTSYSYTPIGRIDNPSGLAAAVGAGSILVKFER